MSDPDSGGDDTRQQRHRTLWAVVRWTTIAVTWVIAAGVLAVTSIVSDCNFAGGRCPSEPEPLLDNDIFGGAFAATFAAVAVGVLLSRPSKKRFMVAVAAGAVAGMVVGAIMAQR